MATITVNAAGGADFTTIEAAIAAAANGDTIQVAAGTYSLPAGDSGKQLTFLGTNAGISANDASGNLNAARGAETIIDGGSSIANFRFSSTGLVTFDGFKFVSTHFDSYETGNDIALLNNVIVDPNYSQVLFAANSDTVTFDGNRVTLVEEGQFDLMQLAGNWNGATGTQVHISGNVVVDETGVSGANSGFNLSSVTGTISGNTIDGISYYGFLLANDTNVDVIGNIFQNITNPNPAASPTWGAGVRTFTPGPLFDLTLDGNTFTNNAVGLGIRDGSPVAITITNNTFSGNQNDILNRGLTAVTLTNGDGSVKLFGGLGNDALTGTNFTDTAGYAVPLVASAFTATADIDPLTAGNQPGWLVDAGAQGIDKLSGVEIVDGSEPGKFLLVGNGGFATIQAAVNAAGAGDTIVIAAGTYIEQVVIDGKAGLTLVESGGDVIIQAPPFGVIVTDVDGKGDTPVVAIYDSTNVTLQGITVDGNRGLTNGAMSYFIGIDIINSSAAILDVTVTGMRSPEPGDANYPGVDLFGLQNGYGIWVTNTANPSLSVYIQDTTVSDFQKAGIYVDNSENIVVASNKIIGVGADGRIAQNGIWVTGSDGAIITGNTVSGISYTDNPAGGFDEFASSAIVLETSENGVVADNIVRAPPASGEAGVEDPKGRFLGVSIYSSDGATVDGNTIVGISGGQDQFGVVIDDSQGVVLGTNTYSRLATALSTNDSTGIANSSLNGTAFVDNLTGGVGDDIIDGLASADIINGGAGNDTLYGGAGNDTLTGGIGNDTILGGIGNDTIDGGEGNDTLSGEDGNDKISGGDGNDIINGGNGLNTLKGDGGNDTITGGSGKDLIDGGADNDLLIGGAGNDIIDGGDGNDTIVGGTGDDVIRGGDGIDTVDYSGAGSSVRLDLQFATASSVTEGNDRVSGIENAIGSAFADEIFGNTLANTLVGGAGADGLHGRWGSDILTGGEGADTFYFDTAIGGNSGFDTITDFEIGVDTIALSAAIFKTAGALGDLQANAFTIGATASTLAHRIIFNDATGELFYDRDGTASGAAVKFAVLEPGLDITHADFTIIA